jgi:hypothetical protein
MESNELSVKRELKKRRTLKGTRQKVPSPEDNQAKQNGPYETRKEDTYCRRHVARQAKRNRAEKAERSQKATSRAFINTRGGSIALSMSRTVVFCVVIDRIID